MRPFCTFLFIAYVAFGSVGSFAFGPLCYWPSLIEVVSPQFETEIDVPFSNYDFYRHVTSSGHLDLLNTALARAGVKGGVPSHLGSDEVYVPSRLEIEFGKPISLGTEKVIVRLRSAAEPSQAKEIVFELAKKGSPQAIYSQGRIAFALRGNHSGTLPSELSESQTVNGRKPVEQAWTLDIRHNDLNVHQSMDMGPLLDAIFTSRWSFLRARYGIGPKEFAKANIGFFLKRAKMSFEEPVDDFNPLVFRSWVERMSEDKTELRTAFIVQNRTTSRLHAHGTLDFVVVDTSGERTGRAVPPDWILSLFLVI